LSCPCVETIRNVAHKCHKRCSVREITWVCMDSICVRLHVFCVIGMRVTVYNCMHALDCGMYDRCSCYVTTVDINYSQSHNCSSLQARAYPHKCKCRPSWARRLSRHVQRETHTLRPPWSRATRHVSIAPHQTHTATAVPNYVAPATPPVTRPSPSRHLSSWPRLVFRLV